MQQKKLFLLDAYALIYRAYYAFIKSPMKNSKGMNTSAIYGFITTLDDVLKNQQPTHIAVVFDPSAPTFRHKMFPGYKAQREETPEAIKISTPYIKEIIRAFNIPVIEVDNYEADDVIGTIAKTAEKSGFTVYMMTPDKDYCQLVSENIFMFKPRRSGNAADIWGVPEVQNEFKVEKPEQVTDILALWGDASDNIPGIPGIGEKTAKNLVNTYGSINAIYENIGLLRGKQKENLVKGKENIKMYKTLVTIVTDVPFDFDEEQFKRKNINKKKIKELFTEFEFRTLIQRVIPKQEAVQGSLFPDMQPVREQQDLPLPQKTELAFKTIDTVQHSYELIDTKEKRAKLIETLSNLEEFCFDTETTGLDVHSAEMVGMSFCFRDHEAGYVPVPANREEAVDVINEFKPLFENQGIRKIGQNIKYDLMMLAAYKVELKGEMFDTMIAHYLVQPEMRHNMNILAEQYLGYSPVSIENLIGKKGAGQGNMRMVPIEKVKEYAAEDADITWQLKQKLTPELEKHNANKLFAEVEIPLVPVLANMELAGIRLNKKSTAEFGTVLRKEIGETEKQILSMAGVRFNIASPKQLGEVLFDKMKIIDNPKKTKTKQYSTSEPELMKIRDKHEIIPLILEFRSLKKLLSTYVEALPKLINIKTGKIHTSFNQAITATGRLSSNNPNLQNIPVRTERGREIRKAFIPSSENHILLSADYSQIELRVMAHISKDENMIAAFKNNEDIHAATAAKIYNTAIKEVTKEMRGKAKSANFGIIYGISAFGLSQNLNISRKEAKELIDGYFRTYPGVKQYMEEKIEFARKNKYAETILGRRRYLGDIDSRNAVVRGVAERNAINAPVQGSAADIIKIAMINIHKQLSEKILRSKMILQVHDELVFDVENNELETVKKIVKTEMENAIKLDVPLIVDMGVGNNWLEAH